MEVDDDKMDVDEELSTQIERMDIDVPDLSSQDKVNLFPFSNHLN